MKLLIILICMFIANTSYAQVKEGLQNPDNDAGLKGVERA